jgi:hypothetical protein
MSVSIVPALRALRPAALMLAVGLAGVLVGFWANAAFFPANRPRQPIEFSHKIHAGDNSIPCMYCHVQARRSISAGVPSVNKCVSCHGIVAKDRPQIRKVMEYWTSGQPIPWIKVDQGSRPAGLRLLPAQATRAGRRRLSDVSRARGDDAASGARRAAEDGLVPGVPQDARGRERARLLDLSQIGGTTWRTLTEEPS